MDEYSKKCGVYISGIMYYYPQSVSYVHHRCSDKREVYSIDFVVDEWMKHHLVYYKHTTPSIVSGTRDELMRTVKRFVREDEFPIFLRIAFLFRWKLASAYNHILQYIPMLIKVIKACTNVSVCECTTIVNQW